VKSVELQTGGGDVDGGEERINFEGASQRRRSWQMSRAGRRHENCRVFKVQGLREEESEKVGERGMSAEPNGRVVVQMWRAARRK
jgi:hypothetical protein